MMRPKDSFNSLGSCWEGETACSALYPGTASGTGGVELCVLLQQRLSELHSQESDT